MFKSLSLISIVAVISAPTATRATVIGLGDDISAGFCVPIVADTWIQRIGAALGQPVVNYATTTYTVAQTVATELPQMGYSMEPNLILVSLGTNDTFEEHYSSGGEAPESNQALVQQAVSLLAQLHAMQPNAVIGWLLPRDWGYNDPLLKGATKEQTVAEIGEYDSALQVYMAQFPYMVTVMPFPAKRWYNGEPILDADSATGVSEYYEAPNVCTNAPGASAVQNEENPSDAAQAMIANDMLTALGPLTATLQAKRRLQGLHRHDGIKLRNEKPRQTL